MMRHGFEDVINTNLSPFSHQKREEPCFALEKTDSILFFQFVLRDWHGHCGNGEDVEKKLTEMDTSTFGFWYICMK